MIKGKIILLPFPFDNLSSLKVRPAVCLTEPVGNYHHIVVAFITSKIPDELFESDIVVRSDAEGFRQTGLKVSSTIRLHRLITITISIIRRELGSLPTHYQTEINEKLIRLFGL